MSELWHTHTQSHVRKRWREAKQIWTQNFTFVSSLRRLPVRAAHPKTKSSAAAIKQHTRPYYINVYQRVSVCAVKPTTIKILIDCNVFNKMKYVLAGSPFILLFDFSASTCRAFLFSICDGWWHHCVHCTHPTPAIGKIIISHFASSIIIPFIFVYYISHIIFFRGSLVNHRTMCMSWLITIGSICTTRLGSNNE